MLDIAFKINDTIYLFDMTEEPCSIECKDVASLKINLQFLKEPLNNKMSVFPEVCNIFFM